jgi:RNA polymerase sigma factor (sigma-70 family)
MAWEPTPRSLLARVRDPRDATAWREFEARYGGLIVRYCRSRGLQQVDAEDVRQLVMMSLAKALPNFEYSPERGRFRNYLAQATRRAVNHWLSGPSRGPTLLLMERADEIHDVSAGSDELWEQDWVRHHYRLAFARLRAVYDEKSLAVFERLIAGESVAEVAQGFGMQPEAVYKVKHRFRDRFAQLIREQLRDEEDG